MAKKDQPNPEAALANDAKDAVDPGVLAGQGPESTGEDQGKPAEHPLMTVKYGGKEYQLPQEFVEGAWTPRESEFSQKLSQQGQELGELRKRVKPDPPQDGKVAPDWNKLIFEDPARAVDLLKQEIYGNISAAYGSQRAVDRFWGSFYDQNQDLRGEDLLVQAIANRPELKSLQAWDENGAPNPDGITKLADMTRREILRLSKKVGGSSGEELSPKARAIVEGAGPPTTRPEARKEEEGPKSIGEVLDIRRRLRQKAGARGGK